MVGMGRLVAAVALVSAVFCAGGINAAPAGAGSAGCGSASYSYAGLQAAERGHGVRATITVLDAPRVEKGHVAAWVGVAGRDHWIQVGVSGFEGSPTSNLYYEISRAGHAPQYFEVEPDIAPVATRTVAVLEVRGHPSWWRVWVNGKPVSKPVHLAGSHRQWRGLATAESWNAGSRACNTFAYRFDRLAVAAAPGGSWHQFRANHRFQSPGYAVVARRTTSFVAQTVNR